MDETLRFSAIEVMPERAVVLELQGVPTEGGVAAAIEALHTTAVALYADLADPIGILKDITQTAFSEVYAGEGRNEADTPVGDIFGRAERLALFAVTLGPRVGGEIAQRFEAGDFAVGCMLDSVASAAADKLAALAERRYDEYTAHAGPGSSRMCVLRYSPGYCGWHVSGQRKLFEFLQPRRIGISLRDSFLMEPLKSVSGVMLAGPREIHDFDTAYPCCAKCETQECRERLATLDAR